MIRNLPEHGYIAAGSRCRLCGAVPGPETVDLNVFNFERHKWGGVRHGTPEYAVFDLEQFAQSTYPPPTASDRSILREIFPHAWRFVRHQNPKVRWGALFALDQARNELAQVILTGKPSETDDSPAFVLTDLATSDGNQRR